MKLGGDPNLLLDQVDSQGLDGRFPFEGIGPAAGVRCCLIDARPEHLCSFRPAAPGSVLIGRGKRMYCREHNPGPWGGTFCIDLARQRKK